MNYKDIISSINQFEHLQVIGPLALEKSLIQRDRPTVFIDGGAKYSEYIDSDVPTYTLGDKDSCDDANYDFDILLPADKDLSDLAFLLEALQGSAETINLLGFFGGRMDHQLFVLGDIHRYSQRSKGILTLDNHFVWFKKNEIKLDYKGTFSIGSFESTEVSIQGDAQYLLENYTLKPLSSQGLSNIAYGTIEVKSSEVLWLYLCEKPTTELLSQVKAEIV